MDEEPISSTFVTSLTEKLESLSSVSSDCCIYRVPERLRESNEKAYTPRVVSIGPLHYGDIRLQAMEEYKLQYLKDFVIRTKVSLEDYFKLLTEREARIRDCYEETINLKGNEFLQMILVDAAFVIEVMLRFSFPNLRDEYDHIFSKRWLMQDVKHDISLLENQLPYVIFEDLFLKARLTIPPEHDHRHSFIRLTYNVFKSKAYLDELNENLLKNLCGSKIEHFVHFLRICHLPPELPLKKKLKTVSIPTATQLHQTGVKFKVRSSKSVYDIRFSDGILEIPRLGIKGPTESLFRNLIAFEQCHFQENYICDYFFVMDRLIDTPQDVELLIHNGIIESKLPDSQRVVTFINNLVPGTTMLSKSFYFTTLFEDLNTFCNVPWHKWKATLKQDYFSTPWAVLSITGAAVLLILTAIQTLCSIISL